jgi:hypothetical protein
MVARPTFAQRIDLALGAPYKLSINFFLEVRWLFVWLGLLAV